jgi:hypothetical protein
MVIIVVQNRDSSKRDFANSLNAISDICIGSQGEKLSQRSFAESVCVCIFLKNSPLFLCSSGPYRGLNGLIVCVKNPCYHTKDGLPFETIVSI